MISLKKYLDSNGASLADKHEPQNGDLLSAAIASYGAALVEMGRCSFVACPGMGDGLKRGLGELQAGLSARMAPSELVQIGENAGEKLRSWGQGAAAHYQKKANEVKELLLTVAQTAESVSARDQRCAGQMNDVTERLKAIASLEDLTEIRASIETSAAELKSSIDRMTAEGKAVLDQLREEVASYQTRLEEAEELASRDALTGLSSRLYVESQLEKKIGAGLAVCVALIDIDCFKRVNDEHGHLIGDELLKQFGSELRSACRTNDVIGRWGGDEFILTLDCGPAEAEIQIERLRAWVCGNYTVRARQGDLKLRVDASIGLAAHIPGEGMKELVERADAAMYRDKAASARRASGNRSAA